MSKRSFLRKSAISLTATLGLGGTLAHAADITLNGNTLQIGSRTVDRPNALRGAYYHFGSGLAGNPPQASFDTATGIRALEAAEKAAGNPNQEADLIVNLNFDQEPTQIPFGAITGDTVDFGTTDQLVAVWSGEIVVDPTAAGVYGLASASDDGSVIHIDGKYALNNNAYQGRTRRDSTFTLSPGVHSLVMGWYEGGGGANGTFYMSGGPTGAPEEILNPSSPLPGLTFRKVNYATDNSQAGMNVIVTANSGINLDQEAPIAFGTLNLGNNTLALNGVSTASFTGTSVGTSPTFNIGSGRLQTGAITSGGATATINKTGGGELVLNQPSPTLPAGNTFNVQAGTLSILGSGGSALGAAGVNLSGGTLSLDVDVAVPAVPVNNAITATANSTINVASRSATASSVTINPGIALSTTGNALTLPNVTASGAGTVTVSPAGLTSVVNLNDGGNAVTFAKGGAGQLALTRTGGPGFGATSKLDVQAGRLVATNNSAGNTLGGAPVTLSGGTLELRASAVLAPGARSIAVKFGADQPDGAGGDDGNSQVTGPAGIFGTANWNNFGAAMEPAPQPLTMDTGGTVSPTSATVFWNSNNLWSSTGQGEENNTASGENRDLMAGYLDTGGLGGTGVTIDVAGLPTTFTSGTGYDVYVYIKGGINGRGGDYAIGNTTKANVSDAPFDGAFIEDSIDPGSTAGSNYLAFRGLTTADFQLTTTPLIGGTARAPVNAIEIVRATAGPPPNFASNVNATQNSSIDVTGSTSAQLGNLSVDAGRTLTITGNRLKVNDVSAGAGGVVAFTGAAGGEVAGSISGAGILRAGPGVTLDLTRSGPAATGSPQGDIARGGTLRVAPGASNTFGGAAFSAIGNEGLLHAASGIADLSGATVNTLNVPGGFGAGLFGGRVDGATNAVDFPATPTVDLRLSRAQSTDNVFFGGDNGTWVYTGEVRLQDTDGDGTPGPVAFGEQFDDFVLLKIEGQEYINNNAWQVPHSSGAIELADTEPDGKGTAGDGWFSFEARFGQGGGGVGPNTGWNIGFGVDTNNANGFDAKSDPATGDPNANRGQYVEAQDPGNMSLFRISNNPIRTGNVQVDAGVTLRVGALVGANDVNVATGGRLEFHTVTSKVYSLNLAGAAGARTSTADLTDADVVFQSAAATKTADFTRLYADLKQGFNSGDWKGLGITSSTAASNPNTDTGVTVVDNALLGLTDFGGRVVDANSLLLKYTYYGDIDQNGQVDADDLTVFAGNFGRTTGATQVDGDIDFNGTVDADDLTIFANNFNKGVGSPLGAASVQAVPEPTSLVLAGLGAAGILAGLAVRRNRRTER